jgi:hypothetical protein
MFFCTFTWRQSNRILFAQFPDVTTSVAEDDIVRNRKAGLGDAWDCRGSGGSNNSNPIENDVETAPFPPNNNEDPAFETILEMEQLRETAGDHRPHHHIH